MPESTAAQAFEVDLNTYASRLSMRSADCHWGLSTPMLVEFAEQIINQPPYERDRFWSIRLWLGRDMAYNWTEAVDWLRYELEQRGMHLSDRLGGIRPRQAQEHTDVQLNPVQLDLSTWQDADRGIYPIRTTLPPVLPALEVIWFLALNPEYCSRMGEGGLPRLLVPGLYLEPDQMVAIERDGNEIVLRNIWERSRFRLGVVATFA